MKSLISKFSFLNCTFCPLDGPTLFLTRSKVSNDKQLLRKPSRLISFQMSTNRETTKNSNSEKYLQNIFKNNQLVAGSSLKTDGENYIPGEK